MTDKNGIEMKTGDVVRIEGAYFANDNGYYFIQHSPGDPSWCGSDYSLKKIRRNGKISTAKHNLAFYPLKAFCNDRFKRAEAYRHNEQFCTIEIVSGIQMDEIAAHFAEESHTHAEMSKKAEWHFGADRSEVEYYKEIANFYQAVADRISA